MTRADAWYWKRPTTQSLLTGHGRWFRRPSHRRNHPSCCSPPTTVVPRPADAVGLAANNQLGGVLGDIRLIIGGIANTYCVDQSATMGAASGSMGSGGHVRQNSTLHSRQGMAHCTDNDSLVPQKLKPYLGRKECNPVDCVRECTPHDFARTGYAATDHQH